MTITLFQCPDLKNVLNKSKNNPVTFSGILKEPCTMTKPIIKLKKNSAIISKNYVYIPEFLRYYFIEELNCDGVFYELTCSCDVLESFKNDFLNSYQLIGRSEKKELQNKKINDASIPFQEGKIVQSLKIGTSPFNTKGTFMASDSRFCFVLNTAGLNIQTI